MPLDTSVRHYTSSMNGASLLDNTANSFIKILDAVLVNGFGNVTLTSLTVSNNIATANVSTGYNVAPYCVVTISGATPSELNGDKKVLSSTANNVLFTFDATGVANGAATGTITCRFPGAGWTKPYANTLANVAVYRNSTSGTGFYLRVNDSVTSPAGLIVYETMTDENTGTNRFPRADQTNGNGIGFIKATAAGRKWWIVADSKTCYIGNAYAGGDSYVAQTGFGDFKSLKTGDAYNYFITGRNGTADTTTLASGVGNLLIVQTGTTYRYIARQWDGAVKSQVFNNRFFGDSLLTNALSGDDSGLNFPNLIDNSLLLVRQFLTLNNMIRGYHRGFYVTPQNINSTARFFLNDEEVTNIPSLPGKILLYKALSIDQTDAGCFFVDVSGPWD